MTNPQKYMQAALAHFTAGEYGQAIRICEMALIRHEDAGRIWELCGTAYWMLGDLPRALEALEEASVLVPLAPLSQLALAAAYFANEKSELAQMVLCHLTELPAFPESLLPKLAASLGRIGEHAKALGVCERIVESRPDYHPAWFGIAYYRRSLKHPIAYVTEALRQAYALAPQFRTYRLNLAICLAESQLNAEAYEVIRGFPLQEVRNRNWLQVLEGVFKAVGDTERVEASQLLLSDPFFAGTSIEHGEDERLYPSFRIRASMRKPFEAAE